MIIKWHSDHWRWTRFYVHFRLSNCDYVSEERYDYTYLIIYVCAYVYLYVSILKGLHTRIRLFLCCCTVLKLFTAHKSVESSSTFKVLKYAMLKTNKHTYIHTKVSDYNTYGYPYIHTYAPLKHMYMLYRCSAKYSNL